MEEEEVERMSLLNRTHPHRESEVVDAITLTEAMETPTYTVGLHPFTSSYRELPDDGDITSDLCGMRDTVEDTIENEDEDEDDSGTARNLDLSLTPPRQVKPIIEKDPECSAGEEDGIQVSNITEAKRSNEQDHSSVTDADDVLRRHNKHVFILTSAGKPVFSRYGDESRFSELFGLFQVLFAVAQQRLESQTNTRSPSSSPCNSKANHARDSLRRVTAGDMSFYFYAEAELFYVLVTRTGEEGARCCLRQLRQIHLQLLSVLPNVNDILSRFPSYDLRRLISSADAGVMRQLIKRNSCEESYLFRCLSAAPLGVERRRWLEGLLTQHFGSRSGGTSSSSSPSTHDRSRRSESEAGTGRYAEAHDREGRGGKSGDDQESGNGREGGGEHHLYSFLLFRGRVVCAAGPNGRDARLHIDDALLLINFAHTLTQTQEGEIWAPICLPKFNDAGYLWCYCASMSVLARESRRGRMGSSSFHYAEQLAQQQQKLHRDLHAEEQESHAAFDALVERTKEAFSRAEGLLLVQLASSQAAFAILAEQAYRISRRLLSIICPLEEELSRRERIPISLVSTMTKKRGMRSSSGGGGGGSEGIDNWTATLAAAAKAQRRQTDQLTKLVALAEQQGQQQQQQQQRREPPEEGGGEESEIPPPPPSSSSLDPPSPTVDAVSSCAAIPFMHEDGLQWFGVVLKGRSGHEANLVCSEPSAAMRLIRHERKRQLRLMSRLRDQLTQLAHASEPLLLVRMHDLNALVVRPTATLVTSLVQQFMACDTRKVAISSSDAIEAAERVKELMLIFLPHVQKEHMMVCVVRVLVRIVSYADEFSFHQVQVGKR